MKKIFVIFFLALFIMGCETDIEDTVLENNTNELENATEDYSLEFPEMPSNVHTVESDKPKDKQTNCDVDILIIFIEDNVELKENAVVISKNENAEIVGWIETMNAIQFKFQTDDIEELKKIQNKLLEYEIVSEAVLNCELPTPEPIPFD